MFRTAAILLLACLLAAMPVGLPAGSVSSEISILSPQDPEAPHALDLVAELTAR